nr:DDE-type integrase/transposase/recombinase [Rhodobacter capsulatus]
MRPRIEAVPSVATAPNERWSTDLARVWTGKDGWASLALVIDCHRRELLSWHLSRSGNATTASAALEHALIRRFGTLGQVNREFLLRSDNGVRHGPRTSRHHGSRVTSRHFTALVRSYGLRQEFITPPLPSGSDRWRLDRSTREPKRHGRARDSDAQGAMHSPPPLREHPARQPRHRRLDRSAALSDPWRSRPHSTTIAALIRPLPCAHLSRHSD